MRNDVHKEIDIYDFERVDQLLVGWQTHTARQLMIHEEAARKLAVFHYALGVPAAIFAAFAGTAAVAGIQATADTWSLAGAGLATASSILAGLQTLLNFGGRTEAHRQTAAAYKRLVRKLELVPPEQTKLADLDRQSERYNEIVQLERELGDTDSSSPLPPRGVSKGFDRSEIHLRHEINLTTDPQKTVSV